MLRQALLSETLSDILVLLIIESVCGWDEMQSSLCSSDAVRADKSAVRGNTLRFASIQEKLFTAVVVSSLGLRKRCLIPWSVLTLPVKLSNSCNFL